MTHEVVTGRVVRMTHDHVTALLRQILALDPRIRPADAAEAQAKAETWHKILAEVDPQFAFGVVHRYYADEPGYAITPGVILTAWREAETEARRAARTGVAQPALPGTPEPPSVARFLRACLAAVAAGEDPSSVPTPPGVAPVLLNGQDRSRLCVYHDICACDHTACRDGWLDDEVADEHPWGGGRTHRRVKRCPSCRDALLMAEERGIARKPQRWRAGGRR